MVRRIMHFLIIIFFVLSVSAVAQQEKPGFKEVSRDPVIPKRYQKESKNKEFEISKLDDTWLTQDSNDDGILDYALILDKENYSKYREGVDSNDDGFIDDFVFYTREGKIEYQEIDSNFDKKIDIWVEIGHDERVHRIQRDMDYDGIVDQEFR